MNKIQYSFILSRFLLQVIIFPNSIYKLNSTYLSSSLSDMQRPETSGHSLEISLVRSVGLSDVLSSVQGTPGESSKNCLTNTSMGHPVFQPAIAVYLLLLQPLLISCSTFSQPPLTLLLLLFLSLLTALVHSFPSLHLLLLSHIPASSGNTPLTDTNFYIS